MRPRYSIARFTMELSTIAGALLMMAGIVTLMQNYMGSGTVIRYLVSAGLAVNGIAVIASAQMGNAVLDTAVSTRELADAMKVFIQAKDRHEPPVNTAEVKPKGLRAER